MDLWGPDGATVIASEAQQSIFPYARQWIASRSLSSGAHSAEMSNWTRLAHNGHQDLRQATRSQPYQCTQLA
jgi:hypothetical protein